MVWRDKVVCGHCRDRLALRDNQTSFNSPGYQVPYARVVNRERYRDFLFFPRMMCLILVAIGVLLSAYGFDGAPAFIGMSGLIFIVLLVAGTIMKANWRQKHG